MDNLFLKGKRVMASIYAYKILFRTIGVYIGAPVRKNSVPCLFIWGNRDAFLDIPSRSEVSRFYENAEIRIVKGEHWVNRSNTKEVNRILENTFNRWSGRTIGLPVQASAEA